MESKKYYSSIDRSIAAALFLIFESEGNVDGWFTCWHYSVVAFYES